MASDLVTLTYYYSIIEAKICVSMLQAHGIYAFAPTEMAGNSSHYMAALGGIPIMVVQSDYEDAKALLDDVKQKEETEGDFEKVSIWKTLLSDFFGIFTTLFFGIPPAPKPPRSKKHWRSD